MCCERVSCLLMNMYKACPSESGTEVGVPLAQWDTCFNQQGDYVQTVCVT
jgi:hypothetical protein